MRRPGASSGEFSRSLGIKTLDGCLAECAKCAACKFISFSAERGDCSWYAHCEKTRLRTDVPAFLTGPRVQQSSVQS